MEPSLDSSVVRCTCLEVQFPEYTPGSSHLPVTPVLGHPLSAPWGTCTHGHKPTQKHIHINKNKIRKESFYGTAKKWCTCGTIFCHVHSKFIYFPSVARGLGFNTIILDVSCCLAICKEELIGSGTVCQREQTLEDSGYVLATSFPEG